jgi:hypothetical protein
MILSVADVKCYHCGHISGEMVAEEGKPIAAGTFKPTAATASISIDLQPHARLRCLRCGGPVYLDDLRKVRPAPLMSDLRPRRGRPRRSEVLARAS